ncbi:TfoX/Sxy family DNA transformation protein [Utexia brackfieldae]|uniref:TfoX/Sxy family DNA transformation protein n=1 Tax=Utexia brackfieldae TaxID=3074108 RepID=UPI00370D67EF
MGNLSSRSMFGGYGILLDNVMFAWVFSDNLYLRANASFLAVFTDLQMLPLSLSTGGFSKLLHYYCVSETIWKNSVLLEKLLRLSISGAFEDKKIKLSLKENRLKDLPNMTLSLERLLIQIGIVNINQLKNDGALKVYYRLKQRNNNISINVLYILFAAINGYHVAVLSDEQKEHLRTQFMQLYPEG